MWLLLFCVQKQFARRFCSIRRLSECDSLTFGERHIVVVQFLREDEALNFFITLDYETIF